MRVRTLNWITLALWLAALLPRFTLLFYQHQQDLFRPEPVRIAITLAATGAFAGAYRNNTGYTAHSAPLYPLMVAPIYYFWGDTPTSDIIRAVLSILVTAAGYALLPWVSRALGMGAAPGIWAGAVGALQLGHYWVESTGGFETAWLPVFFELSIILLVRLLRSGSFTLRSALIAGLWSAAGVLLSPSVAPVLFGFLLILLWRIPRESRRWAAFAVCAAALAISPWIVRNYLRLGGIFFIRDNFGLELYLSNSDHALVDNEMNVNTRFFHREHPFNGGAPTMEIKQKGELAFERDRQRRAIEWIRANPRRFLDLTVRRAQNFWLLGPLGPIARVSITVFYFAALAGWVMLWRQNRTAAFLLGSILVTYPAIYYLLHNGLRYAHPIFWLKLLLAGQGGVALLRQCGRIVSRVYTRVLAPAREGQPA